MTDQESRTPFEELPDQYKMFFFTETRERLRQGHVITLDLDSYQSIKIMDASTELYSIPEIIQKLEQIQIRDDGAFEEIDWPTLDDISKESLAQDD